MRHFAYLNFPNSFILYYIIICPLIPHNRPKRIFLSLQSAALCFKHLPIVTSFQVFARLQMLSGRYFFSQSLPPDLQPCSWLVEKSYKRLVWIFRMNWQYFWKNMRNKEQERNLEASAESITYFWLISLELNGMKSINNLHDRERKKFK